MFPVHKLAQKCFIMIIGSPNQHIYYAWKTILAIWLSMKRRELQKSQFPNCYMNGEIFRSAVQTNIKKSQFSIFFTNQEGWGSEARATFKNPSLRSLSKLRKTWKYSQPKAKIPKSQFWIYWWIGESYFQI